MAKITMNVIYTSDWDLLESYAKRDKGPNEWVFNNAADFDEWFDYALTSEQFAGTIQYPNGKKRLFSIEELDD